MQGDATQADGGIGSLVITTLHTTSLTIWQDMPMGTIAQHTLRVTNCFLIGFEARSMEDYIFALEGASLETDRPLE